MAEDRSDPRRVSWDPNAMLPRDFEVAHKNVAPEFQAYSERLAEAARQRMFRSAQGAYRTAQSIFSNYRPGGAQMLASGLMQQRAQTFIQQAEMTQAPDMMGDYRRDAEHQARVAAKRAGRMSMAMGALSLGASVATAGLLGTPTAPGTAGQTRQSSIGAPQDGGYGGTGSSLGAPQGNLYGAGLAQEGPGTAQGAPGMSGGQEGQSGAKVPGPSTGGPQGGQESAGRQQGPQSGGAGGMAFGAQLGGYGSDGDFSPTALAAAGARAIPVAEMMTRAEYAQDVEYDTATPAFEGLLSGIMGQLARLV